MATESTTGSGTGAIHDIGYRRYEGERLGTGSARASLLVDGLRGAYGLGRTRKAKVAPMLLLGVMCLPALGWVVVGAYLKTGQLPVGFIEYLVVMQVLVSIFVGVLSPAAVSRDLRFRVMPLYLSRPLPARDYVAAKLLATSGALLLYMLAPLLILLFGGMLAEVPTDEALPDFLRGAAIAVLLALLLGAFGLLVASLTRRRGAGIAAIVTTLLVTSTGYVFLVNLAGEIGSDGLLTWSRLVSPYPLVEGVVTGLTNGTSELDARPDGVAQVAAFAAAYLGLVASCVGLLLLRYRRVSVA